MNHIRILLSLYIIILAEYSYGSANTTKLEQNIQKNIKKTIKSDINSPTLIETQYWQEHNSNEIKKILYSYGFFDAQVKPKYSNSVKQYHIELNDRYTLNEVRCLYDHEVLDQLYKPKLLKIIDLPANKAVTSKQIARGAKLLKEYYCQKGYYFAFCDRPILDINSKQKTVNVTYPLSLGPLIIIDQTSINIVSKRGNSKLEKYVRNRLTWKTGDVYNPLRIDEFKDILTKSDIFESIDIQLTNIRANEDNSVAKANIIVCINEGLLRSIEGGAEINTEDYFSLSFGWRHSNIDKRGSQFAVLGSISASERDIRLKYSMFDLLWPKMKLVSQAYTVYESNDSYNLKNFGVESMIWHPITRRFEVGIGGNTEKFQLEDSIEPALNEIHGKNFHNIWSIPTGIRLNLVNNILDPRRGLQFQCDFVPNFAPFSNYQALVLKLTQYISFHTDNWYARNSMSQVFVKYGSIFNSKNGYIPRHKWFFSGGANSVRGYGAKKVSELNNEGKPIGGKYLFEFGIEHTVKIRQNIGLSVFFDGGKVAQNTLFEKNNKMLYSWGFGAKYYTILGIIRLDLAFPFKRRVDKNGKKVDRWGQIYMRVG